MAVKSAYEVNLATLPIGENGYDFSVDTEFFKIRENPEVTDSDVQVHVDIVHKNDAYYCTLKARGMMQIPCDRCLEPMNHPIDEEYPLTIKYGSEYDDSDDGIIVLPESQAVFDFAPVISDMLLLTIPMRHVHAPGECDPSMERILTDHSTPEENEYGEE